MARNYDNYGYENEYRYTKDSLVRRILIVVMVIIAILLFIYLIKGCTRKNSSDKDKVVIKGYEAELLEAAKSYYNKHNDELPNAQGECSVVELHTLIEEGLIDSTKYGSCNTTTTLVKVCILENGKKHYSPWLTCVKQNSETEYGELKVGSLMDIKEDSTYVQFEFLPQEAQNGEEILGNVEEMWKDDIKYTSYKTLETTKYYRYRDKLYIWDLITRNYYSAGTTKTNPSDVNEYYTVAPSAYFPLSSNKTTEAYKWYTSNSKREYYTVNGQKALSTTPKGVYTIKDPAGVDVTRYRTRSVTGTYSPYKYYMCSTSSSSSVIKYQLDKCGTGVSPEYSTNRGVIYSCTTDASLVRSSSVPSSTKCKKYSSWSDLTSTKCDVTKSDICEAYTITFYYWYRNIEDSRIYYPSGSSRASGENTYYITEPFKGAIKDTSTKATAYKWYNETVERGSTYQAVAPSGYTVTKKTSDSKWSNWTDWSTKNPNIKDGREREIENKTKIKLQEIQGVTNATWKNLNEEYLSETGLIKVFQDKGYKVNTLEDISNNGEIRYLIRMFVRNKKESK